MKGGNSKLIYHESRILLLSVIKAKLSNSKSRGLMIHERKACMKTFVISSQSIREIMKYSFFFIFGSLRILSNK